MDMGKGLRKSGCPLRLSINDIKFAGNDSRNGGYADVVVATLTRRPSDAAEEESEKVAVKKTRFVFSGDTTEDKLLRLFVNELRILNELDHENIVKIVGFVEDVSKRTAWLVFPWEENGNLREFLSAGEWDIPERVSLISDVANGLEYLHGREPPICHGDLKSLNILINASYRAVITDFGSARILRSSNERGSGPQSTPVALDSQLERAIGPQSDHIGVETLNTTFTLTGPVRSFRWESPEIANGEVPNRASDVWALGWIVWEAMTDCYPFQELQREIKITIWIINGQLPTADTHNSSFGRSDAKVLGFYTKYTAYSRRLPAKPSVNAVPEKKANTTAKSRSATLLLQIGKFHLEESRIEQTVKAFNDGLSIAERTRDIAAQGGLLLHIADVQKEKSQLLTAARSYTGALVICNPLIQGHALKGLGDVYHQWSKYTQAEKMYLRALDIFQATGDILGEGSTLCGLAETHRIQKHSIVAGKYCSRALHVFRSHKDDWCQANELMILGATSLARRKHNTAEQYYQTALNSFTVIMDNWGRRKALSALADLHLRRKDFAKAKEYTNQALETLGQIVVNDFDQERVFKRVGTFGPVALRTIRGEENTRTFETSRRLESEYQSYQSVGSSLHVHGYDTVGSGTQQRNGGNSNIGIRNSRTVAASLEAEIYTNAQISCIKATSLVKHVQTLPADHESRRNDSALLQPSPLALLQDLEGCVGGGNAVICMGDFHRKQSNYSEATICYTRALEIFTVLGSERGQGNALKGLADTYRQQSRRAKAKVQYALALDIFKRAGDSLGYANSLGSLGDLHQAQYQVAEAEKCYVRALDIFIGIRNSWGQVNLSLELGKIRLRQGRYSEATDFIKAAEEAQKSFGIRYDWAERSSAELLEEIRQREES
ncbi:hypothetical protein FRB90_003286 [Tulasnella sp. 427]|nr:hypothetical protein FRB90_003286 [Tulasnella sp. 427]